MMKNFFFSHPIEASLDPRMEAMEEKLHGKGAGVYWYIREKMSFFSNNRCRLKQLKPFATKYYTFRLMEQVVLETDLFDIDGDVITPRKLACELGPDTEQTDTREPENLYPKPRKTTAKNDKNTTKNSKKTVVSDENRTKNDENPAKNNGFSAKNEEKSTKNDGNLSENSEKTAKNVGKTAKNSGKHPLKPLQKTAQLPDKKESNKNIDAKSDKNTSTIYKEREKEREKDVVVVIESETTTTTTTTATTTFSPLPAKSGREYVARLARKPAAFVGKTPRISSANAGQQSGKPQGNLPETSLVFMMHRNTPQKSRASKQKNCVEKAVKNKYLFCRKRQKTYLCLPKAPIAFNTTV